jgi:hypothetical protein
LGLTWSRPSTLPNLRARTDRSSDVQFRQRDLDPKE